MHPVLNVKRVARMGENVVVRHVLRLCVLIVVGAFTALPAAAQRDVRHSAIPDFDAVAAANRGVGGFYLAGGFGYGLPATRAFGLTDGYACPGAAVPYLGSVSFGGSSGCSTSASLSGLSAHVLAGWNFGGPTGWVSGIELRGRLGRESGNGRLGGTTSVTVPGIGTYTNSATGAYRGHLDAGLAVAGRFGYAFSSFFPFVKAGIGMARLAEEADFDATGSRACSLGPPVSCTSGGVVSWRSSRWLPSAVLGVGVEVPLGRMFIRLDGELEAAFSPSSDLMQRLAGQALTNATGTTTGTPAAGGSAALRSDNWVVSRRLMLSAGFRF
jgi:hypothetical protein